VWRTVLVALLSAIAVWLAIDALIVTDAERVEAEVERLVDLARQGGEEAAQEILAALADDYRGTGFYSRANIESRVRRHLVEERPEELSTGKIVAVPKGEEVVVPLLTIHVRTRREEVSRPFRVTFAERDGRFRIVNVENWGLER